MLLEIERHVRVLLNDLQDLRELAEFALPLCASYLDPLCNNLVECELRIQKARVVLLPQVRHRHLDAISGCYDY